MKARILSVLASLLMVAVVLAALPLTLPRLAGIQIYSVLTASMEPALPVGSAVYVKSCDASQLAPGDIVTFTIGGGNALVKTHRVVSNDTGARQLITKGDANPLPDIDPVAYGQLMGKVIFTAPILGAASQALHSPTGVAACIAIFALALILWTLADKLKKRESFK